eukprot:313306-Pyramimonas_sp.AAC.1
MGTPSKSKMPCTPPQESPAGLLNKHTGHGLHNIHEKYSLPVMPLDVHANATKENDYPRPLGIL